MRVGLLGPLEVVDDDGRAVQLSARKPRELLALLALRVGDVVPTDVLIEDLWGDEPPADARNALQVLVRKLRAGLAPADVIATQPPGYRLDVAPDDVDVVRFDRLIHEEAWHEALALWRGEPLADFIYDAFAQQPRSGLRERWIGALECRIEADLASGEAESLVSELEELVVQHPLRERFHAQLMRALYRAGRQADALRAFQSARTTLADELGLEPGPELRSLELAVLRHGPELQAPRHHTDRSRVGNLPARVSGFVGRDTEFALLVEALRVHRLVTLTGPGGAGKTRLALEVGRHLNKSTPDGVWLAELAPLADGTAVGNTIALAVGAHDIGEPGTPVERLLAYLRDRHATVILDNCEHVLDEVAIVAAAVLAGCPDVRLIATSREPLAIDGETQQPVPPLSMDAAACLFGLRAASVRSDFALDDTVRGDVENVCTQLDGLPLAIELAAARVKALPVGQIAARLQDRFRLLAGGSRDAAARHRTLRAAVEWSYDLLFEEERLAFRTLSVFPASFDLAAAEAVWTSAGIPGEDVVDMLAHLIDKSLLVAAEDRYRLLDTLRHFGNERISADERIAASQAHATHFLALAAAAEPHVFAADQVRWLDRLDEEIDNLRAAVRWAARNDPNRALEAVAALAPAAWLRGHRQEARQVLEQLLAHSTEASLARCRALRWSSHLADDSEPAGGSAAQPNHLSLATERSAAALALAETLQDRCELAHCQRQHATTLVRQAVYAGETSGLDEAAALLASSEATFRELGDDWGEAVAVVVAMFGSLAGGDLQSTEVLADGAWPLVERAGDRFLVERVHFVRALLAEVAGDAAKAEDMHARARAVAEELGFPEGIAAHRRAMPDAVSPGSASDAPESMSPDEVYSVAVSKAAAGHEALAAGDVDRAEELFRASVAIYESKGDSAVRARILAALEEIARRRNT